MSITSIILVACGGSIGAVLRFTIANLFSTSATGSFPFGTICVNVLGCACIGLIAALLLGPLSAHREIITPLIIIGVLGGFTTYSTFALDSLTLLQNGKFWSFCTYLLISNTLGILFAYLCFTAGSNIFTATPN